MNLLVSDNGDRLDLGYLSGALTLGDCDTDTELCEVEELPQAGIIVGRLSHPGDRPINQVAGALLDAAMPPSPDRWWLDLRGGVVITGICHCGGPADLPDHIYDLARYAADAVHATIRRAR
ncbi:hypothetical protein [Microbispora sp. NBRC 16548]|uniref:hypothetical protein n=1 Tax=Microbispora sp. NBRC 16548 TaxID=3030994 RepID=UPI0016163E1E|nr:hypothetical protein [Microbispora sp. NBRC 16548]GLX06678.1 hypothetical protein Misp03_36050 [Microbispora sp. NBRC 16548]